MKDPTPLVDHIYETFVEIVCHGLSPCGFLRSDETLNRLLAQGKDINSTNLFNTLYTESRVPLFGHALYNQFVYIKGNYKGEGKIVAPSKLYVFNRMSKDDVPLSKFAEQDGSEEAPECILWITEPDAVAVKSLFSTCYEISKHQPVTHLLIDDVSCKDLTPAEVLLLSRNIQVVAMENCDLPISFWKKILHQLFDCVNLRSLWFENTNLNQLEEDLDKLFQNIDSNTGLTNRQVEVHLLKNNFSETFVKKWNGSSSGIICNFQLSESNDKVSESSDDEDDFTLDEITGL